LLIGINLLQHGIWASLPVEHHSTHAKFITGIKKLLLPLQIGILKLVRVYAQRIAVAAG